MQQFGALQGPDLHHHPDTVYGLKPLALGGGRFELASCYQQHGIIGWPLAISAQHFGALYARFGGRQAQINEFAVSKN